MSYDLMVFEPDAAPADYVGFLAWFAQQMECREEHSYTDAAEASERLGAWLREMVKVFPSGAGQFYEDEPVDLDEDSYSGYSVGREMIYVIFVPVKAELARRRAFELAERVGVGVFEPGSEKREMWRPDAGRLVLKGERYPQEAPETSGFWRMLVGKVTGDRLPTPRLPEWMS